MLAPSKGGPTVRIPDRGTPREQLRQRMDDYRKDDLDWREGRTFGYVYDGGAEAKEVSREAYMAFLGENALDPTVYPSVMRFENELVAMAAAHVGGDEEAVGSFTSGGTESIVLAVKAARDRARAQQPSITRPNVVMPDTAHAAFHKAGHYLGVDVVTVPVDPQTFLADVDAMAAAVTHDTILLVGSAPSYAHGVIDPIEELADLAQQRDLLLHVDACIGGFLLPWFRRLGEPVPPFGFDVPGVTSLSMDLHKYAYCDKGASLVLYRDKALRRFQLFACAGWPGYSVVNTTAASTKPAGPMAAAWAVLNFLGEEGYLELARGKLEATRKLVDFVEQHPDLQLLGRPQMCLVAFHSETVNLFHVIDLMRERRWYIQAQLTHGSSPHNIHLSISASNVPWMDGLLTDLAECIEQARTIPPSGLASAVTAMFADLDPADLDPSVFEQMLGMAGMTGTALPGKMAEINEVLDALSPAFREFLLTEFINGIYQHREGG